MQPLLVVMLFILVLIAIWALIDFYRWEKKYKEFQDSILHLPFEERIERELDWMREQHKEIMKG